MSPLFASNAQDVLVLSTILGTLISATICGGMVFLTGAGQGKIGLAVLGTVIAIGVATFSDWRYSIPTAIGLTILISLIPNFNRPLLADAEVEAEMRRARTM